MAGAVEAKDYGALRSRYRRFVYRQYDWAQEGSWLVLRYHFGIDGLADFSPEWRIPVPDGAWDWREERWQQLFLSLGMVEALSYWKISCAPDFHVQAGLLPAAAWPFWEKLVWNGLGEFRYRNGIATERPDFVRFHGGRGELLFSGTGAEGGPAAERAGLWTGSDFPASGRLIPVGGGKDSVLSLCLLEELKDERSYLYCINGLPAALRCMERAAYPKERRIVVQRSLDPRMLELNREGYLNGHTPFSALVAFSALLVAEIYGLRDIVLSNEASANESSVHGSDINHQYSKSLEFEADFSRYCRQVLGRGQRYFSLLRPLSEYAIINGFVRRPEFLPDFCSCNLGGKEGRWCGHCAKCLFIALMLLPYYGVQGTEEILGAPIFSDPQMLPHALDLLGCTEAKPFECVGTVGELSYALVRSLNLGLDKVQQEGRDFSVLAELRRRAEAGELPQIRRGEGQEDFVCLADNPLVPAGELDLVPEDYRAYLIPVLALRD